jgi:alginate O-acetyltransferase complex protein AlgJ
MFSRRILLPAGAGLVLARPAPAQVRGNIVFGKDNHIFAGWEDIRRASAQRMRPVVQLATQVIRILKDAGMEVAVPLIPTRARVLSDMLPPDFQPNQDAQRRYEQAMAQLRQAGAIVPDYATLLTNLRTSQREAVFFKADSHWTAVGAEAAAIDMANAIKGAVQLPASRRPGTRLGNFITNVHSGDFLQLLPEADKPRFPAERFRIRQAAAASGGGSVAGGLLEDDNADVVVVGNSYMQPYFGYPHVLSSALARPVALVWKTARVGPYRTLLDYVTGSQFRAQRPKVLLWQLMEGSLEQMPDAANWWEPAMAMPAPQFLNDLRRAVAR